MTVKPRRCAVFAPVIRWIRSRERAVLRAAQFWGIWRWRWKGASQLERRRFLRPNNARKWARLLRGSVRAIWLGFESCWVENTTLASCAFFGRWLRPAQTPNADATA